MDWNAVSVRELLQGISEDGWGGPRSLSEFLAPRFFSVPRGLRDWTLRLKANAYLYRCNYLLLACLAALACCLRSPLALAGVLAAVWALLMTSDSFCSTTNDSLLRAIRRLHAPTALRLRARAMAAAPDGSLGLKRRPNRQLLLLAVPRRVAVLLALLLASLLLRLSAAWLDMARALALALGLPLMHATLRVPNLKSRMASAKHEFRAMWRGYQATMQASLAGAGAGGLGGPGPGAGPSFLGSGAVTDFSR